jgi:hypothetical protein
LIKPPPPPPEPVVTDPPLPDQENTDKAITTKKNLRK